jgi:hypothetical protein
MTAVKALVAGQAAADREAGLDWSRLRIPASRGLPHSAGCRKIVAVPGDEVEDA